MQRAGRRFHLRRGDQVEARAWAFVSLRDEDVQEGDAVELKRVQVGGCHDDRDRRWAGPPSAGGTGRSVAFARTVVMVRSLRPGSSTR